jgi:hypothetical protein
MQTNNALACAAKVNTSAFSAQAVRAVLPEAVSRANSGYLQINNDPILWTMLNAIKEQQSEIEQLKRELHKLRAAKPEQKTVPSRKSPTRRRH